MKNQIVLIAVSLMLATGASAQQQQASPGRMAFTVTMPHPETHVYHVMFKCENLRGESQDFKMPVWTPGFYQVQNFAQFVQDFKAEDGDGKALEFEKTTTNTWRVHNGDASVIVLNYDVRTTRSFVGTSYLDEHRGYIMAAGVCMHMAGQILHPVTLTLNPPEEWPAIATGLDPVSADRPHTFTAPDFDVLYDSPILMGKLDELPSFEIQGVRHSFYGYNLGVTNGQEFMDHLKQVVSVGIDIIGEVPYNHYTFIGLGGGGGGGIEHLNSTSFGFSGTNLGTHRGMVGQLDFLAHEYFHNFNVKRIRPIVLGPFDYDHEDRTRMLWVSEGLTSYYEYLMLSRSGNMSQEELLDAVHKDIATYENTPGRLYQSVAQSSWDTWSTGSFGGGRRGGGAGIRKTISYYNKGPALGMMLDFKIRHETQNRRSLDTVMRTLYRVYYKQEKRGWTDEEFRKVCEDTAGVPLTEFFDYVNTVKEPDYAKYFAYAGVAITPPKELAGADLGTIVELVNEKLTATAIEPGSAAERAGLAASDVIGSVDGATVDVRGLNDAIAAKKPGDKMALVVSRGGADRKIEVTLGHKLEKSWVLKPIANPDKLQAAILKGWATGQNQAL